MNLKSSLDIQFLKKWISCSRTSIIPELRRSFIGRRFSFHFSSIFAWNSISILEFWCPSMFADSVFIIVVSIISFLFWSLGATKFWLHRYFFQKRLQYSILENWMRCSVFCHSYFSSLSPTTSQEMKSYHPVFQIIFCLLLSSGQQCHHLISWALFVCVQSRKDALIAQFAFTRVHTHIQLLKTWMSPVVATRYPHWQLRLCLFQALQLRFSALRCFVLLIPQASLRCLIMFRVHQVLVTISFFVADKRHQTEADRRQG